MSELAAQLSQVLTILSTHFFCWQDETLFASPKKVRPGEEDAFAAALSERSRRRSSPGGKKSPAKSEEPEMIQVITKDLIRRLRLVLVLVL